jgi:hypothetical protein
MTDLTEANPSPAQAAPLIALSKGLRWSCYSIRAFATLWVLAGGGIAAWNWMHREDFLDRMHKAFGIDPSSVSDASYWSAATLTVVPFLLTALVAYRLWRLTQIYLDGRVFTIEAAAAMRSVARTGFTAAIVGIVFRPIQVCLLSTALLGKLPIFNWFNASDLFNFLVAGFVLALSVILKAAAEIVDDHAQIV